MALQDFPELHVLFVKAQEETAAILKKSAPLRVEMDKLRNEIAPLDTKLRKVIAEIKKIEMPRLGELDRQIAAIAKGTGGRLMSQGGLTTEVPAEV